MRLWWILALCMMIPWVNGAEDKKTAPFRFHLIGEPHSLDPAQMRGSSGSYLFNNIHRSLFRYHPEKGLQPEGAKTCAWVNDLRLRCHLNPMMKWSDGSTITSHDYVRSFRRLLDPQTKTVQTELLLTLKNAKEILSGQKKPDSLGIKALSPSRLQFDLARPDFELLYKLTSPTLAPIKDLRIPTRENASKLIANGPYVIETWEPGKIIRLKPNPHYPKAENPRPMVEVLFVEDDSTALRLYEAGRLSLLRRLVTAQIPAYKGRADFLQIPMARFDYVGFSKELSDPNLREALIHALKYKELRDLYHALGKPGCPSLPPYMMDKVPCFAFDLEKAKQAFKKVPERLRKKRWTLAFSKMGGDDILKGMEWIQNQWKKHLGLEVELQPVEQGMYVQNLTVDPPQVFRKGLGLDRPTCLAALEVFDKDSRENYLNFNNSKYQNILSQLKAIKEPTDKKIWCRKGVEVLLRNKAMIPLGQIHYTMLAKPEWQGWTINQMNQLDLSQLHHIEK